MHWIDPIVVTGPTATGRYYFPRPSIEQEIWTQLEKGANVLLAAPRRVGKSSVMQAMERVPAEGIKVIFKNIQGIKSEEEFYKTMFDLLLMCLSRYEKGTSWISHFLKGLNIQEITLEGVKFGDKKPMNYELELEKLLTKIVEEKEKVVLLLDELPEVLNNLYKSGKVAEASSILNKMRQWRQTPALRDHLGMVLAGSVGIHHIVKLIEGRIADINDYTIVPFPALIRSEAKDYIQWATESATVKYDDNIREYLLDKIQYFIPYFISLMLDQINRMAKASGNPVITTEIIDAAFDAVIKNNENFTEWSNRLSVYFPKTEATFLHEVLAQIAQKGMLQGRDIYNIAGKHGLQLSYMDLLRGLERDGYLIEANQSYQFVSPFLQAFWKSNHPIYE